MENKDYILIIKHKVEERPGIIEQILKEENLNYSIVDFEKGDKLPKDFENMKNVISLGGPMNVYEVEKYKFLKEEEKFIKEIEKYNIPFLGICLGSQILAKIFGAKVNLNQCNEIGFYDVELTEYGEKDKIFNGICKNFSVFQYHSDCFEIPQKGILIVKGKDCYINQGIKVGENLYGFQFHIEIDEMLLNCFEVINFDTERLKILKQIGRKIIKIFLSLNKKEDKND
ncbi:MAG: type 1 glutamine amidotransferase [Candidatus Ratteibacteria bacterium]